MNWHKKTATKIFWSSKITHTHTHTHIVRYMIPHSQIVFVHKRESERNSVCVCDRKRERERGSSVWLYGVRVHKCVSS